jgi:hypothetical protein
VKRLEKATVNRSLTCESANVDVLALLIIIRSVLLQCSFLSHLGLISITKIRYSHSDYVNQHISPGSTTIEGLSTVSMPTSEIIGVKLLSRLDIYIYNHQEPHKDLIAVEMKLLSV